MRQARGNDVMVRFILTEEERTPATDQVRGHVLTSCCVSLTWLTCQDGAAPGITGPL
jgi:hypothetical protein